MGNLRRTMRAALLAAVLAALASCGSGSANKPKAAPPPAPPSLNCTRFATEDVLRVALLLAQGINATIDLFTAANWATLDDDPSGYECWLVDVVGKVIGPPERDANRTYFQIYADPTNDRYNTIVEINDPTVRLAAGDLVRVKGFVRRAFKGTNRYGDPITAPLVIAKSVRHVSALATAPPAVSTLGSGADVSSDLNIVLQVRKVELAATETRVFVAVTNLEKSDVTVEAFEAKLIVNGVQHDPSTSLAGYPELSTDLAAGAQTSGVIVFPPLTPNFNTLLFDLDVLSADPGVGDYGTVHFGVLYK
jgi:hypothetical protein